MRKGYTRTTQKEAGQAVIEYVLMLLVGVMIITILTTGLRRVLFKSWTRIAKEVSAGCPTCQSSDIRSLGRGRR